MKLRQIRQAADAERDTANVRLYLSVSCLNRSKC